MKRNGMSKLKPTPQQLRLLETIRQMSHLPYSPTHREIARAMGCSRPNVAIMLDRLEEAGFIRFPAGRGKHKPIEVLVERVEMAR